jgi:hypothetical protein
MRVDSSKSISVLVDRGHAARPRYTDSKTAVAGCSTNTSDAVQPVAKPAIQGLGATRLAASNPAAKEVMSRYDVTNIRYTELVQMANELRACGALAEADYLDFIGPSPECATFFNAPPDAAWNRPRNKIEEHRQQIAMQKSLGVEQRFIDFSGHLLALFIGFVALQPPGERASTVQLAGAT